MRYRKARRKMLVVHPDGEHEWRAVDLVIDTVNASVGVQLVGDGQLKGTIIFVAESDIEEVKNEGEPADRLLISE